LLFLIPFNFVYMNLLSQVLESNRMIVSYQNVYVLHYELSRTRLTYFIYTFVSNPEEGLNKHELILQYIL
jgi:hypothetical protein